MGDDIAPAALVTGGAGFIGSHLVDHLLALGGRVCVLDDLSTGRLENLDPARTGPGADRLRVVVGTCADPDLLEPEVAQADVVFHLASVVGVELVMREPVRTIESTVDSARAVLGACARHGRRVVVTSSSEVYGDRADVPFREDDPTVHLAPDRTRGAFAAAKSTTEFLALAHHRESGLPVTVVRLFNVAGPRQLPDHGMVLPSFVACALAGRPLLVHGDGTQRRSFSAVADVVDGLVRAGTTDAAIGCVLNLGADEEVTILDLAHRVVARSGSESPVELVPYSSVHPDGFVDHRRRLPDLHRARTVLGWSPTTPLDAIIDGALAAARRPTGTSSRTRHARDTSTP